MEKILKHYTSFHSPGYIINTYNKKEENQIIYGNRQIIPTIEKNDSNTLYDIASITKLYTSTLVYIAYEEEKINLYSSVNMIVKEFVNLKEVKVIDLLNHNQNLWTNGHLGSITNKKDFYNLLYTAYVKDKFPKYVDLHYIILSHLLEKVYNKPYKDILEEKIINKLKLKNTTTNPKSDNIASNNYHVLNNILIDNLKINEPHDIKARVCLNLNITTGHASIFTNADDLMKFLKTFFDYSLLKKETIELMLQHEDINKKNYEILKQYSTHENINIMYKEAKEINNNIEIIKTYNNMGTRFKNDIKIFNDVPEKSSKNTIVFSGFTGVNLLIDFDNEIIIVVMCNLLHKTKLNRLERKQFSTDLINIIYENLIKNNR